MSKYDSFHPPVDSLRDALSTIPNLSRWDNLMTQYINHITANTALKVGTDHNKFFVDNYRVTVCTQDGLPCYGQPLQTSGTKTIPKRTGGFKYRE